MMMMIIIIILTLDLSHPHPQDEHIGSVNSSSGGNDWPNVLLLSSATQCNTRLATHPLRVPQPSKLTSLDSQLQLLLASSLPHTLIMDHIFPRLRHILDVDKLRNEEMKEQFELKLQSRFSSLANL